MDKPLDVKGLAELLGVGTDWVYTQVEAQRIPFTRLPGEGKKRRLIRFTADHVAQILAAGEQRPATTTTVGRPRSRPAASTQGLRRIA